MNETAVMMPSVTHAMKAKKIFLSLGYKCLIKRASGRSDKGCTHYITVNAYPETVISILERNNIKYGEILPEAVGT
ncbi:MAG: DUF3343 domain-containing protein [Ruminococcus sp.]|nr:DUF3343 domain-containing protein [Ruminococcus sp.]